MAATLFRNDNSQLIRDPTGALMRADGPCCCLGGEVQTCSELISFLLTASSKRMTLVGTPVKTFPDPNCVQGCSGMAGLTALCGPPFTTPGNVVWPVIVSNQTTYLHCGTDEMDFNVSIQYQCQAQSGQDGIFIRSTFVLSSDTTQPPGVTCVGDRGDFGDFFPFPTGSYPVEESWLQQGFELPYIGPAQDGCCDETALTVIVG